MTGDASRSGRPAPAPSRNPPTAARSRMSTATLEQVRLQRLRWAGLAILLSGLLAFFHLGFFLYAVAVVAGLGAISWWVATSSIAGVAVEREVSHTRVEPGSRIEVRLTVKNVKALPIPWLYWEEQVESGLAAEGPSCGLATFRSHEIRDLMYRLELSRRGLYRIGPAVLESSDPFGLVRRYFVGHDAAFVTVLPKVVAMGQAWPTGHRPVHEVPHRRSLFEDPTRFVGVRDYQPADSRRRIHWRTTARTGRLQSRVYEPSVLAGMLLVVDLHPASYADPGPPPASLVGAKIDAAEWAAREREQLVELAVTTAASLADFVLGGGQSVGLFSNGADAAERYPTEWSGATFRHFEGALAETATHRVIRKRPVEVEAARGQWQRETLRTALARLIPSDGVPMPTLLAGELPRLPRSLVLTVITPRLDRELAMALAMLKRSGFELAVVWLGPERERRTANVGLPEGVPVYYVSNEHALARLGACRL